MTPMERIEGELSDAQKRIAELEYLLARQAKAAIQGMDAAKVAASSNLEHAKRLHAESNPDALESERAANALLTERIAQLEVDCAAHKAAEEVQIALRQKADEREAALINLLNHFKAAAIKASMNGFGQDDEHHDDSWIDDLDHALTRTQHHDAKLRKQAEQ